MQLLAALVGLRAPTYAHGPKDFKVWKWPTIDGTSTSNKIQCKKIKPKILSKVELVSCDGGLRPVL